jgi:hypothetical protein
MYAPIILVLVAVREDNEVKWETTARQTAKLHDRC